LRRLISPSGGDDQRQSQERAIEAARVDVAYDCETGTYKAGTTTMPLRVFRMSARHVRMVRAI
jgi:hypothetical protein